MNWPVHLRFPLAGAPSLPPFKGSARVRQVGPMALRTRQWEQ